MFDLPVSFASLLTTVQRPGDFFVSGTTTLLPPLLVIQEVGQVALPLLPVQAEQIIAVAEAAPFGRGEQTILDPTVRRGWQIGVDRLRLSGRHWADVLATILARVARGFGIDDPIEAELYKLLIYDRGSFFVEHRDTEKVPGMFATLVIALPSSFTGGELVVRHQDREACLNLQCTDPAETVFAAFYADCVHEVRPVTDGFRLTLTYNLIRCQPGCQAEIPDYADQETGLAELLKAWQMSTDSETPKKLVYPLEHAYTQAELDFPSLKGRDIAVARVVATAAQRAECDLRLALLTIEESGAAECAQYYGYGSRYGRQQMEDAFEAGEIFERSVRLSDWHALDGPNPTWGSIPVVEQEELSPPTACDDLPPDKENFYEATGNEGASFERSYHRAALVLWPRERIFAVLSQGGLPMTLPHLDDLLRRWETEGRAPQSVYRREAENLARHMIASWPRETWYPHGEEAIMLSLLARLDDESVIERFLMEVTATRCYEQADNVALLDALERLSLKRRVRMIEQIIADMAEKRFWACADLLARAARTWEASASFNLTDAADCFIEKLQEKTATSSSSSVWENKEKVTPEFVVNLLAGLTLIDERLTERAVQHLLMWPKRYDLDAILVPALRKAWKSGAIKDSTALEHLREVCLDHLRARIAEPLEPPADWRRASKLPCACESCCELTRFLDDPQRAEWTYKAAQVKRTHAEEIIKRARADVDVRTERRGSPHGLICKKNQASYECRVRQRTQDLADVRLIAIAT